MTIGLISDRFNFYRCQSVQEEEHAIREISQEVILAALARSNFFKVAAFHGGTCPRLFYGLNRFSEDLDFFLKKPNVNFNLNVFLSGISSELKGFGYQVEISDRSQVSSAVKKAFIKDQSIGKLLNLVHRQDAQTARKLKVKIEVDTDPPGGSEFENKYADFPKDYFLDWTMTAKAKIAAKIAVPTRYPRFIDMDTASPPVSPSVVAAILISQKTPEPCSDLLPLWCSY